MPLRFTIMPYETIYINGAIITNGSRNADFVLQNHCRMLREKEMIKSEEADTACKKIVLLLQEIHLKEHPIDEIVELSRQCIDIVSSLPGSGPYVKAIQQALDDKKTHVALKRGKDLVAYEAQL